ncbi:MAG: DNA polymerase III subunit beta [Patescibacteria group bacterium]
MKFTIDKDLFSEKLTIASRFTSNKVSSIASLQGVLLKIGGKKLSFYATNLSTFYTTSIELKDEQEETQVLIDPKKVLEFIHFMPGGSLDISLTQKQITLQIGKTKGNFPISLESDFPFPPEIMEKPQKINTELLQNELPLVLFSASSDDTRPVLTGVNFLSADSELLIAATDGFRLSVLKEKKIGDFPSMIIPADFLQEVIRYMKDEKEVRFSFSAEEKIVLFSAGDDAFYSRLIEGDYPPFERVIPAETKTTVTIDRAELQRNIKLISVFARDFSSVVVCEFSDNGLIIRPKKEGNEENTAFQEVGFSGESQTIAFNYKFVLEVLSALGGKEITIEILRPDAPAVFRSQEHSSFMHVIMPVRIQE